MRITGLLVAALLALHCAADQAEQAESLAPAMTQEELSALVRLVDPAATGSASTLNFTYEGVQMGCISDMTHGRMRIVAPIVPVSALTAIHVASILEANYHSALDARYATSNGVLYAAFIHPLPPLTAPQLASAIRQVASLVQTFGSTYSSGELVFGEQGEAL
jgi:hypothetical protein